MGGVLRFAAIVIVTSIAAWVLKVRLKRRMEKGLGRKVDDSELTSISTWMKVPDPHHPPEERDRHPK